MTALEAFLALRALPFRRIVGLNSGTSADGIDAAVVRVHGAGPGTRIELEAFVTAPWPIGLRDAILGAVSATDVAILDVRVGAAFADAAQAALAAAGDARPDLIGSHGQTLCHLPPSAGAAVPTTLQLGRAAVLAERLGVPVISDFRSRDLAAGGEGAPLVPLVDALLFGRPGRRRALQNIGGIANVTFIGPGPDDLVAFDTGPGNMPLDEAARLVLGTSCDRDGAHAARGTIDRRLVAELLDHPFFSVPPPRSTGRESFGTAFVAPLVVRFADRPDDLLATLTQFVAKSIARAYADRHPDDVVVSGGGVHNTTLMAALTQHLAPARVFSSAAEGIDPDAKEAIAFAVLANETLFGRPGNVPAATGARGPRILGQITL